MNDPSLVDNQNSNVLISNTSEIIDSQNNSKQNQKVDKISLLRQKLNNNISRIDSLSNKLKDTSGNKDELDSIPSNSSANFDESKEKNNKKSDQINSSLSLNDNNTSISDKIAQISTPSVKSTVELVKNEMKSFESANENDLSNRENEISRLKDQIKYDPKFYDYNNTVGVMSELEKAYQEHLKESNKDSSNNSNARNKIKRDAIHNLNTIASSNTLATYYIDDIDNTARKNKESTIHSIDPRMSAILMHSNLLKSITLDEKRWHEAQGFQTRFLINSKHKNQIMSTGEIAYYYSNLTEENQLDLINNILACRKLEKVLEDQAVIINLIQQDIDTLKKNIFVNPETLNNDQFINLLDLDAPVPNDYFQLPECTASFYTKLYSDPMFTAANSNNKNDRIIQEDKMNNRNRKISYPSVSSAGSNIQQSDSKKETTKSTLSVNEQPKSDMTKNPSETINPTSIKKESSPTPNLPLVAKKLSTVSTTSETSSKTTSKVPSSKAPPAPKATLTVKSLSAPPKLPPKVGMKLPKKSN